MKTNYVPKAVTTRNPLLGKKKKRGKKGVVGLYAALKRLHLGKRK